MIGNEKPDRKINQVFTLVAEDKNGLEGIILTMPPMMVSTLENANRILAGSREAMIKEAKEHGVKIKLVRFVVAETVEVIE